MTHPASKTPVTRLCTHTLTSLHYRDADLVEDLMGKKTFTEVMLMQILGRTPRGVDLRITDVVLIVLMEHGLTPSAIATRLIYMSAPENLQGAVSAGLLAVGSSFVGTMENCSGLLDRIAAAQDPEAEALAIARHYKGLKSPVPGFGHHLHKPVDPRAYKLLEMGRAEPDLRGDKIGYKIREHSLQKIPYLLVVGEKERQAGQVAVRARGGKDLGVMTLETFLEAIGADVLAKAA